MHKRTKIIVGIVATLVLVFAVSGFAGNAERRLQKKADRAAAKAETGKSNLTSPGGTATLAFPADARFYTVNIWWDEEGGFLREVDPSTGETLDEIEITMDDEQVAGLTGVAQDPTDGTVYVTIRLTVFDEVEEEFDPDPSETPFGTLDLVSGEVTHIADLPEAVSDITFDADGNLFGTVGYGVDNDDHTLYSIDPADGSMELLHTFAFDDDGTAIAVDPVSGLLYRGSGNSSTQVFQSMVPGENPTNITIVEPVEDDPEPTYLTYLGGDFIWGSFEYIYVISQDGDLSFISELDHTATGMFVDGLIAQVNDGDEGEFVLVIPDDESTNGETYTFECTDGLPDGAVCEFTPDEVTINDGPEAVTLTVHTDGSASLFPNSMRGTFALWLMLPGVAVVGLVLGRRNTRVRNSMFMLLLLSVMLLMPACGGEDNRFGGGGGGGGDLFVIEVTATSDNDTQTFHVAMNLN